MYCLQVPVRVAAYALACRHSPEVLLPAYLCMWQGRMLLLLLLLWCRLPCLHGLPESIDRRLPVDGTVSPKLHDGVQTLRHLHMQ